MTVSNTLLKPSIIAKEALMQLTNNLGMAGHVHRAYKNEFVKVGSTITIRKPNKFRVTKAQARTNSNITEPSTSLEMATQAHVSWSFSSVDLTTTIDEYSKRYLAPAASALANQVDVDLCGLYKDIYNSAGTPGNTPATFGVLGNCQQILDNEAVNSTPRVGIMNPNANWALADGLKGTFSAKAADSIYSKGFLGKVANLDIYSDQNVVRHTTGIFTTGATPVMSGATASGATSVVTTGWDAANNTVVKGDVFTIAGVYAVNPVSGASTGELRKFTATAAGTSDSGNLTIAVSPAIISSGAYQTVDAVPLTTAALTFLGAENTAYPQNLVYHPDAFALVTVPIEMPANVWGARETDSDAGISIRVVKQYDLDADNEVVRMDILYGVKTLYPELACRLWG
ncbi:MAG: P22 phage major capsid protein family protein [Candidatus Heimdallarchaeaceae archaeon]